MKESLSQQLSQKLQQKLSPMQVQFVRVLEMNGAEIEDEVRRAVDDNPALETVDDSPAMSDETEEFGESAEQLQLADYASDDDIPSYRLETSNRGADDPWYEPIAVSAGRTLQQSLLEQLVSQPLTDRERIIGEYIIGNIDDNGYLTRASAALVNDIAVQAVLEVTVEEVREMIARVRQLEPPGVGAVDLRECLLLQLKRKRRTVAVTTATEIIAHYFDLFSHKHFSQLKSSLEIDDTALNEAMDEIKSLNPKPGAPVDEHPSEGLSQHISPDFNVEVDGDDITVTLYNNIPQLQIEETFNIDDISVNARNSDRDREALGFIRRKRDEAAAFIKILGMRQATLYRVMTAIVRLQRPFFITGDEMNLRPMILKDVAEITGDDLSVISRAAAGKYVATNFGIYPLKFFFNERPMEETDTSTHEIMGALRSIIDGEDKRRPLSDEAITSLLVARGYPLARRTVAKYRERLGIPVARLRKEV